MDNTHCALFDCRKISLSENLSSKNVVSQKKNFGKFDVGKFSSKNLVSENLFRRIQCRKICCPENLLDPCECEVGRNGGIFHPCWMGERGIETSSWCRRHSRTATAGQSKEMGDNKYLNQLMYRA